MLSVAVELFSIISVKDGTLVTTANHLAVHVLTFLSCISAGNFVYGSGLGGIWSTGVPAWLMHSHSSASLGKATYPRLSTKIMCLVHEKSFDHDIHNLFTEASGILFIETNIIW